MIVKSNVKLSDQQVDSIGNVRFHDGVFRNCRFTTLSQVEFKDCTFENCDFSSINLSSVTFKECFAIRCDFRNILVCGDLSVRDYRDAADEVMQDVKGWRTFSGNRAWVQCDFRGAIVFGGRIQHEPLFQDKTNNFQGAWLGGCVIELKATGGGEDAAIADAAAALSTAMCLELWYAIVLDNSFFMEWVNVGIQCPSLTVINPIEIWLPLDYGWLKLWTSVSAALRRRYAPTRAAPRVATAYRGMRRLRARPLGSPQREVTHQAASDEADPRRTGVTGVVKRWLTDQIRGAQKAGYAVPWTAEHKPEDIAQAVTSIIMQQQAMYRKMNPSSPWFSD